MPDFEPITNAQPSQIKKSIKNVFIKNCEKARNKKFGQPSRLLVEARQTLVVKFYH